MHISHSKRTALSKTTNSAFESSILQAACSIYQTYYHPYEQMQQPKGVAVDRISLRGKLIFAAKPILLPKECFVPLSQIQKVATML